MKDVETILLLLFSNAYQRTLGRKDEFKYRILGFLLFGFLFIVGCLSGHIRGDFSLYCVFVCCALVQFGFAFYTYRTGKRVNEHGPLFPNTKRNVLIELAIGAVSIVLLGYLTRLDPESWYFSLPALLVAFLLVVVSCLADWICIRHTQPEENKVRSM